MYGYEIATALGARSDGIFALGQGTLYPLLYSLESKGLIRVSREEEAPWRRPPTLLLYVDAGGPCGIAGESGDVGRDRAGDEAGAGGDLCVMRLRNISTR